MPTTKIQSNTDVCICTAGHSAVKKKYDYIVGIVEVENLWLKNGKVKKQKE